MNIYDFTVKNTQGEMVSMENYRGKLLLIVNTATHCGFTPQYEALQTLYEKYQSQGFEILDFPCNQFANQAPESESEIQSFCSLKYKTTFPLFAKVEVNGNNEEPLFAYLKKHSKAFLNSDIKWNFTKFLVSREGKVIDRYAPMTKPEKIEKDIVKNL